MMGKKLNYKEMRALHISVVFAFTIGLQQLFHFPRAGWIGFTVMLIYAGFDNGTTLLRAYHRFWGAMLGVMLAYVLCLWAHFDYRAVLIIMPMVVFFAYFFLGQAYSIPTTFTVSGAILAADFYFKYTRFNETPFMLDYAICTIIAFVIVFSFEFFWFSRYRLMRRFIIEKERDVLAHLKNLFHLLHEKNIKRPVWFKMCMGVTRTLAEVGELIRNSEFESSARDMVGESFNQFIQLTETTFVKLKAIYFASFLHHHDSAYYREPYEAVARDLDRLEQLLLSLEGLTVENEAHA
ncbi:MAG: hypothetical protein A3J38_07905 [Gammaproteobacteria bacterium RIFCSPHIGHO2_12_FULL_45_9]|nr:MAG: hypothetical protein A3J38_07905 [Gammaproteobacteria bacterium RIFCSPHIGHO2_12_FULL_45_9]